MEKRVREILPFFVAPRPEFAPAVCACLRTLFSTNTSTLVVFVRKIGVFLDQDQPGYGRHIWRPLRWVFVDVVFVFSPFLLSVSHSPPSLPHIVAAAYI